MRDASILPPLPAGVEHAIGCGGDEQNRNMSWSCRCAACMYRYGFKNGISAARGGVTYADGSRVVVDKRGGLVVDGLVTGDA